MRRVLPCNFYHRFEDLFFEPLTPRKDTNDGAGSVGLGRARVHRQSHGFACLPAGRPCLGGLASKGGLHPSRLCKQACDAASDEAHGQTAQAGCESAYFRRNRKWSQGTSACRVSRTPVSKQGSVEQARLQNGDLLSSPVRRMPDGRRDSVCVRRFCGRKKTSATAPARSRVSCGSWQKTIRLICTLEFRTPRCERPACLLGCGQSPRCEGRKVGR